MTLQKWELQIAPQTLLKGRVSSKSKSFYCIYILSFQNIFFSMDSFCSSTFNLTAFCKHINMQFTEFGYTLSFLTSWKENCLLVASFSEASKRVNINFHERAGKTSENSEFIE